MPSSRDRSPRGPGPVGTASAVSVKPCSWKIHPIRAVLPACNFNAASIASCWPPEHGQSQARSSHFRSSYSITSSAAPSSMADRSARSLNRQEAQRRDERRLDERRLGGPTPNVVSHRNETKIQPARLRLPGILTTLPFSLNFRPRLEESR